MSRIAPLNLIAGDGERTSRSHELPFVSPTSDGLREAVSSHRLKVKSKDVFCVVATAGFIDVNLRL